MQLIYPQYLTLSVLLSSLRTIAYKVVTLLRFQKWNWIFSSDVIHILSRDLEPFNYKYVFHFEIILSSFQRHIYFNRNQIVFHLQSLVLVCIIICDGFFTATTISPSQAPVATQCNFEVQSVCGFTQAPNDQFDWTWQGAKTSTAGTGPTSDHTYGTAAGKSQVQTLSL
jgi:hypothetical protein